MTVAEVLGTDFDGNPSDAVSEVLLDGLEDPRRAERIPALVEITRSTTPSGNSPTLWARRTGSSTWPRSIRSWTSPTGVDVDGQLDSVISAACSPDIVRSVTTVVQRGPARLRDGDGPRWDVATQLVDMASGIAVQAGAVAVDLTIDLMTWSPHSRLLRHAADVLARTDPALTTDLILAHGGDTIAPVVADARRRQQLGR